MLWMRAMILSAGYGTRLWPLTEDRTKPAIPILGKPLVGYVAEYIARYGWNDVLVNLHHRPESVKRALGTGSNFGVKIEYIEEPEILGTSGALDNARSLLDSDTFLVVNGKIITDIDLSQALETHRRSGAIATMVLLPNIKRERFTVVETKDGFLDSFGPMPAPQPSADEPAPLMFTGIQFFEPRIFNFIPRGVFSDSVRDVYPKAMAAGERIAIHEGKGRWYELSTIQRYLDISLLLMAGLDRSVFAGQQSVIEEGADVSDSILWDNVMVEAGATVRRAILGDDVRVAAGEVISDAAVVRAELILGAQAPPKALKGEIRGSNFVVSLTQ